LVFICLSFVIQHFYLTALGQPRRSGYVLQIWSNTLVMEKKIAVQLNFHETDSNSGTSAREPVELYQGLVSFPSLAPPTPVTANSHTRAQPFSAHTQLNDRKKYHPQDQRPETRLHHTRRRHAGTLSRREKTAEGWKER